MLDDNTLSFDGNDWARCFVWLTWYLFFDLKDESGFHHEVVSMSIIMEVCSRHVGVPTHNMSVVCGVEAIIYVHLLLLYLLIETSTRQYYVSRLPVRFRIQKQNYSF